MELFLLFFFLYVCECINKTTQVYSPADPSSPCLSLCTRPHSGEGLSGLLSCNLLGVEVGEESRQPVVGLPWGLQVQPG